MTNWRDLKPGDRVRVTFDTTVDFVEDFNIVLADGDAEWTANSEGADAATWELLAKPLRVGPAKYTPDGKSCQVLAIHKGLAWIQFYHTQYHWIKPVWKLVNIDEEPQP